MCGIAGIFAYRDTAPAVDREELLRVREAMRVRGPDGEGLWVSEDGRVGLAHRRLAIIDPSADGAQPMATPDSRLCVTFNGEIYNYRELRHELEAKGCRFRSQSDTEVLLHLYAERGPEMVYALRGMYAFGIWDAREQSLFLARDPFGIKPLYYADDGQSLRFASQVKALLKGGAVDTAPEPAGSVGFLILGAVPEPFTLYRGVRALPAGAHLTVRRNGEPALVTHFSIRDELARAQECPLPARARHEVLAEALHDTVRHHLVSDVPVGVFLSSGLDSALVTALASEGAAGPLRAITLGFDEYRGTGNDEVPLAQTVAARYGARHEASFVSREDFESELENILAAMDQPSTDGVNTYFVSRAAARSGLKVALSGLGGDELFGGYSSFRDVPRLAEWLRFVRLLPMLGRAARFLSAPLLRSVTSPKFAGLLEYGGSYGGAYLLRRALFMPWELDEFLDPTTVATGLARLDLQAHLEATIQGLRKPRPRVAALELSWYMRNQLLRDADWAGMAHSLEIRLPLVDIGLFKALAPFLVGAEPLAKLDAVAILKASLPEAVVRRHKTGFGTPVREWVAAKEPANAKQRGLRGWALRVLPPQPRMFRALALVTDAFGGRGGIALYNRDFLSAVSRIQECAQIVVIPRLAKDRLEPVPTKVDFRISGLGGKLRYVGAVLKSLLQRSRYDVVICAHMNLLPLAYVCALLRGRKLVLLIYGIDAWQVYWKRLMTRLVARVDQVISISEITALRFAEWSGIDRARIALLPNAIHMEWYGVGPKSPGLIDRYNLSGKTVLMTMGRLEATEGYKGFDEVIEVLPKLLELTPNLVYLIVGEGTDTERLRNKVISRGIQRNVTFTGWIPEPEKADHYRLADLYVMPSRGEGFGFVLLEAMACGVPVIASKADGGREAVRDGELGELVDPENPDELRSAVLRALKKPKGLIPPGLDYFSHRRFEERTRSLFGKLLGQSAGESTAP